MTDSPHQFLHPSHWKPAIGYSNGVAATGRMVFTGGLIGWNANCEFETDDFVEQVAQALRTPPPAPRASLAGRFFGVAADSRAWTALFYMLLSLATGIVYFTTVVTGISVSAGVAILVIGIPVVILFIGLVRLLSLVEGRIVEVLLGERMPRRPLYTQRDKPWLTRLKELFTDGRTWTATLYLLLMHPLGILYFSVAITLLALAPTRGLWEFSARLVR